MAMAAVVDQLMQALAQIAHAQGCHVVRGVPEVAAVASLDAA